MHIPRIRTRSSLRKCMAAILPICMASTAIAQEDEEDVYMMNPFEVNTSEDIGYLSTNSTSGTSLNTPIKDLPMAIQVVNADFISDLGASDAEEALSYSSGVFSDSNQVSTSSTNSSQNSRSGGASNKSISSAGSGSTFANVFFIRGLAVPYQSRMGFRYGGLVVTPNESIALGGLLDSVNTDRLEVVKGPNSLLYGVGVLTGIVNVEPVKPLNEPKYKFTVKAGDQGFLRTTAEATGPIAKDLWGGELNYRLAGTYEEKENWVDDKYKEVEYWVAQLEYVFPENKGNLFLEFQQGKTTQEAGGTRYLYDDVNNARDTEFRNEYDEAYNWAKFDGTLENDENGEGGLYKTVYSGSNSPALERYNITQHLPDGSTVGPTSAQKDSILLDTSVPFVGGDQGRDYNMSGTDVYEEREEWNFIADFKYNILENLSINLGAFFSDQETTAFDVNEKTRNGMTLEEIYRFAHDGSSGSADSGTLRQWTRDSDMYSLLTAEDQLGLYGRNTPIKIEKLVGYSSESVNPGYIAEGFSDDIKFVEYFWTESKVKSESQQYRARLTYNVDAELFGVKTSHTFLAGFSYIIDDVDFPDGAIDSANARASEGDQLQAALNGGAASYDSDALHYRSIADFSPFEYDGGEVVRDGDVYMNQEIWQQGIYGIYQGQFFDSKLGVIIGMREDTYNADELIYKRVNIDDEVILAESEADVERSVTATLNRLGLVEDSEEWITKEEELTSLYTNNGAHVRQYYREYYESADRGNLPGTVGGSERFSGVDDTYGVVPHSKYQVFAEDIEETTSTFALNYKLTDSVSIYGVLSEGISPNTALKDGNGEVIDAESTENKEIGIKFDIGEGFNISGSIAVFEIERENAIYDMPNAPNPSKWADAVASDKQSTEWTIARTYDPTADPAIGINKTYVDAYVQGIFADSGIDEADLALQDQTGGSLYIGIDKSKISANVAEQNPDLGRRELIELSEEIYQDAVADQKRLNSDVVIEAIQSKEDFDSFTVEYILFGQETFDNSHQLSAYNYDTLETVVEDVQMMVPTYAAFMQKTRDDEYNELFNNNRNIYYDILGKIDNPMPNNHVDAANAGDALVTFDETIEGYEADLVLTFNENFQIIMNYSHIETEADDSFHFAEWQSIVSDEQTFTSPFTRLHREYGWEQAGYSIAIVDMDEYKSLIAENGNTDLISIDLFTEKEFVADIDGAENDYVSGMSLDEMIAINKSGKQLLFIDKRGNVIKEGNTARSNDYDSILQDVSLNFNAEDTAALWGRYSFTEGFLDNLTLNLGVKYTGDSETSTSFNSAHPLTGLRVTPKVKERYQVDCGASYKFSWEDIDFKLSLNVYNLLDETYDIETIVLDTPNPATGEIIEKRTEKYYSPISYKVGLTISF